MSCVMRIVALVAVAVGLGPATADAHLAKSGPWMDTLAKLQRLYPAADPNAWKVKRHTLSDAEVERLEKQLRLSLYPEDRKPAFYFAQDTDEKLVGVAVLVDPRPEPKVVNGEVVTMEVAVGVDATGTINGLALIEHDGDAALGEPAFLDQLVGRNLGCSFVMGKGGLVALPDAKQDSQDIANAAREALLLMKTALGVDAPTLPCPR